MSHFSRGLVIFVFLARSVRLVLFHFDLGDALEQMVYKLDPGLQMVYRMRLRFLRPKPSTSMRPPKAATSCDDDLANRLRCKWVQPKMNILKANPKGSPNHNTFRYSI